MKVTRWEPFHEMQSVQERMQRLLQDRLSRFQGEESLTGTLTPPVDIYETEHELVLESDMPGMELSDLDIRVENNTLTICGERKLSQEVKEENYHRVERGYGSLVRTFTLPNTIDTEKIQATYTNGVLRLTMAKREETKPKQIRVQIGKIEQVAEKKQAA